MMVINGATKSKNIYQNSQMRRTMTHLVYSCYLVLLLGLVNLPCGFTHIASVLKHDGTPLMVHPRGPVIDPVPSPESLRKLEQINREAVDDNFFNPEEAIRNLLSLSSSSNHLQGMKRVSQFHGNENHKLLGVPSGTYYRPYKSTWEYDDEASHEREEDEKPTFVPFIGARALTNIPEFFAHLKENLEALPRLRDSDEQEGNTNGDDEDSTGDENEMGDTPKDHSRPASRRLKTELHVDENVGGASGNPSENWTSRHGWKPHAAGHIHYYPPKVNFIDSQQNILRRANNYNPAWLYTNLGLGKRRR